MKKYVQRGFILLISAFLLLPMVVRADVSFLELKADSDNLYFAEGNEVRFTLGCVNYKMSPAYQSSLEKIDDKELNTHGAIISYDDNVLEFVGMIYKVPDDMSDITSPDSKINVDTSKKGQLKYSFEKDFGSAYYYNVIMTFKVKEGSADSSIHKIGVLNDDSHSREFRVVKSTVVESETKDKIIEEKNGNKMINYVSYGVNAVLLVTVICLALKKKN